MKINLFLSSIYIFIYHLFKTKNNKFLKIIYKIFVSKNKVKIFKFKII
jgi:hypothetical protein